MKTLLRLSLCFLIAMAISIALTFSVFVPIEKAHAEEVTETTTETTTPENILTTDEVIDSMGGNLSEEDKGIIKELVDKVSAYTSSSDSFFIRTVVPIIVAGVLCLIVGMIMFIPWLKNKFSLKAMKNAVANARTKLEEKDKEIEQLKASVDTEKIKSDIQSYIKEEVKIFMGLIQQTLTFNGAELSKIDAVLVALLNGAINAWQGSPEAVACLTQVADAKTLKSALERNVKLEAYIVEKYGETALKEIESL